MTKSDKTNKLRFVKSAENSKVPPLSLYYEEIYANNVGIKKLGLRGDRNYLYYNFKNQGTAYNEINEMELSAQSVFEYFQSTHNRRKFLESVSELLQQIHTETEYIEKLDFTHLSLKETTDLFIKVNQLHGWAFSHYIVSQPFRMKKIEEKIAGELQKRVARSRVDHYMTLLATLGKPTTITYEQIDWLRLIIKHKKKLQNQSINVKKLDAEHPDFYRDLKKHFETYKSLTLGDGNWKYDINYYTDTLKHDYRRPLEILERLRDDKLCAEEVTKKNRDRIIKELRLEKGTIRDLDFLAAVGHTRLVMRIEGWMPFVMQIIKIDIELSKKLNFPDDGVPYLNYMTESELIELSKKGTIVDFGELKNRVGENSEFLLRNDNGKYRICFGAEARKKYRELVPAVDHKDTIELKGSTAVAGHVIGTACVYNWGDNVSEKIKTMRKHSILIAGQTRPSMMPMIRLAKGIVTDEGGVTSHAAIVSRELGIPSVIGTVHATKIFKDGDKVELDADNGLVRKL